MNLKLNFFERNTYIENWVALPYYSRAAAS